MFAIDCHPTMFEQDMEGIAPIQAVFDQIKCIMLYKVLAYPADQMGIILFNTVRLSLVAC